MFNLLLIIKSQKKLTKKLILYAINFELKSLILQY